MVNLNVMKSALEYVFPPFFLVITHSEILEIEQKRNSVKYITDTPPRLSFKNLQKIPPSSKKTVYEVPNSRVVFAELNFAYLLLMYYVRMQAIWGYKGAIQRKNLRYIF